MENVAFIALGSNLGERMQYLKGAVTDIADYPDIKLLTVSSIYETEPVGYENQDSFLNMVMKVQTSLSPEKLLKTLQAVEEKHGRTRGIYWGPRTLDLDILLYNQENIETEQLQIPHPRMTERAFVMIPLLEIEPNISIPNQAYLNIDALKDKEGVRLWKRKNGEDVYALFVN